MNQSINRLIWSLVFSYNGIVHFPEVLKKRLEHVQPISDCFD